MLKRYMTAVVTLFVFAAAGFNVSHASSMLSSPMHHEEVEGLIFVGEQAEEEMHLNAQNDEVLYVTLKKQVDKIWGPETVRQKMEEEAETPAKGQESSKYPKILVKYKVRTANNDASYKYKHTYSSRHQGAGSNAYSVQIQHIDITPIIIREAKRNNICPKMLKGVIQTESNFNAYAVSPAGAKGLCQLMPGTARMLGVTDPFNPEQSIMGGAKYLGMLKKMFKSTDLILAAYNAGPGNVSRSGGVPNIYETKRFIQKVRKNMAW